MGLRGELGGRRVGGVELLGSWLGRFGGGRHRGMRGRGLGGERVRGMRGWIGLRGGGGGGKRIRMPRGLINGVGVVIILRAAVWLQDNGIVGTGRADL